MLRLKVVPAGNRLAFDIIDGPDYDSRHQATSVYVQYRELRKEGRIKTYANDPQPFGPSIRHYQKISEQFIKALNLHEGREYHCVFHRLPDGSHLYELTEI